VKDLGKITITFDHATNGEWYQRRSTASGNGGDANTRETSGVSLVSEKAVKGEAISHSIG
jgi:hypothetical protein